MNKQIIVNLIVLLSIVLLTITGVSANEMANDTLDLSVNEENDSLIDAIDENQILESDEDEEFINSAHDIENDEVLTFSNNNSILDTIYYNADGSYLDYDENSPRIAGKNYLEITEGDSNYQIKTPWSNSEVNVVFYDTSDDLEMKGSRMKVMSDSNGIINFKYSGAVAESSSSATYTIYISTDSDSRVLYLKVNPKNIKKTTTKKKTTKKKSNEKKITKKKKSSKYKIITTKAKFYWVYKKSGKFKVSTKICDMTAGFMAPYKYVDTFLYKNGKLLGQSKYKVKMKINGKWTKWLKAGWGTNHHRHAVKDSASVGGIKVKVHK